MTQFEILVAEDERLVAHNLKKTLERMGYSVPVTVAYAEQALQVVAKRRPDLVLMDIRLKGEMDGIEAAEVIKSEFNIPVVYLTSYSDEETLARAVSSRTYGYLLKPFQERALEITIKLALSKHQMEKKLQEREQWLNATLAGIGDAVIATDRQGSVLFVNPVFSKLTGYGEEQALGRNLREIFHVIVESRRSLSHDIVASTLEDQQVAFQSDSVALAGPDQQKIPISLSAAPIRDSRDESTGVVIVFRDISREKSLEKQLRQSQTMEALSTLAGGIAHDFNNILAAIMGYTELSMTTLPDNTPVQEHLNQVLRATARASDLVDQILTFCRRTEKTKQPTRLQTLLKEALKLLKASIPSTIEIRSRIDESCGPVLADPTQLHQVVMNLCTNAYYAMRDQGGILDVGLDPVTIDEETSTGNRQGDSGRYVRLSVKDTGTGISPGTMSRIFDPYFTTKPLGEGTGLGLSVVHGIVKSCNGFIRLKSDAGKGTRFRVYFPVHDLEEPEEVQVEPEIPTGSEHVLVVDDEQVIIDMVRQFLERLGYEVTCCSTSAEAWDLVSREPQAFDLVITDQMMPQMTGCMLAAKINELERTIPVILATGVGDSMIPGELEDVGIRSVIKKPFIARNFGNVIRQVLDSHREDR